MSFEFPVNVPKCVLDFIGNNNSNDIIPQIDDNYYDWLNLGKELLHCIMQHAFNFILFFWSVKILLIGSAGNKILKK